MKQLKRNFLRKSKWGCEKKKQKTNVIFPPAADLKASWSVDVENTLKRLLIGVDHKFQMSPLRRWKAIKWKYASVTLVLKEEAGSWSTRWFRFRQVWCRTAEYSPNGRRINFPLVSVFSKDRPEGDRSYSSSIASLCATAKQISQPTGMICVFCFHADTVSCASRLHSLQLGWSNMFLNSLFLSIHQPLEKNNMALPWCGESHSSNLPPGVS